MKPSSRSNEPAFRITDAKWVGDEQPQERLIADRRAGLTPADMVEQRLQALLHCSALMAGTSRLCLPRADGRMNRTIEYAPIEEPEEGISPREANSDREATSLRLSSCLE